MLSRTMKQASFASSMVQGGGKRRVEGGAIELSVTVPIVTPPKMARSHVISKPAMQQILPLALSYSILDTARHPSQGRCCAFADEEGYAISINPITAVNILFSKSAINFPCFIWLLGRTGALCSFSISQDKQRPHDANSSSSVLASFRSSVSKPSANQP